MPGQQDEATLEALARDVYYEVNRLFHAAILHPETPEERGKRLILEALLLHFRNILDFFYGEAKNPDDVHASHFFPDPSQWNPVKPAWLREYRQRCHKLLAHLTYSRLDYKERGEMVWKLDEKLQHLRDTWYSFLDSLPSGRRRWFR
jgi:hypothetical protein